MELQLGELTTNACAGFTVDRWPVSSILVVGRRVLHKHETRAECIGTGDEVDHATFRGLAAAGVS
jgi:hypothetical protein